MIKDYIEYLQLINANLERQGIDADVKLKESTLEDDVNKIEQYLYFNSILKECDSTYKILDVMGYKDKNLYDFLRLEFYKKYKDEWIERSKNITLQPKEVGKYLNKVEVVSPLEIKVFTESLNLEQPLVLKEENKETTNIFSKDELVEDDFVYDYEDEINEEEELEEDTNEEYLTVSKKIEAELQEITPLYKSLMLDEDDDDIDIDYVDSEPDLHIVDLDYGEEEALDYLEYDEYADSEIEDILNEVDEEIEETLSPKPKIIDFKSRQTTIEANKIVSLVNIGMGNLFDIVSPIYKEVDIKEDTDESLEDEDEDLEDLEELEDEELEEE